MDSDGDVPAQGGSDKDVSLFKFESINGTVFSARVFGRKEKMPPVQSIFP